jgi:hypothetical protein
LLLYIEELVRGYAFQKALFFCLKVIFFTEINNE